MDVTGTLGRRALVGSVRFKEEYKRQCFRQADTAESGSRLPIQ
jgi:hypothetical protein